MIRLISGPANYPEFSLENEQTKETLYLKGHGQNRRETIIRYTPVNRTLLKEEWFKQAKRQNLPSSISVQITEIGVKFSFFKLFY